VVKLTVYVSDVSLSTVSMASGKPEPRFVIKTGPRPAENAWARVDNAKAVSAVCVITTMPS